MRRHERFIPVEWCHLDASKRHAKTQGSLRRRKVMPSVQRSQRALCMVAVHAQQGIGASHVLLGPVRGWFQGHSREEDHRVQSAASSSRGGRAAPDEVSRYASNRSAAWRNPSPG